MPALHILFGILLFSLKHPPPCSAATINGTLAAGQVLTVRDKLVSRNGKFVLGFFQPTAPGTLSKSANTTTSPNWYLGIWFNKIPVFTTVWVANRETPITEPNINQTQLEFSTDGNLVVVNHAKSIFWSTSIANMTGTGTNTSAVILNTGNLAIVENQSSDVLLWQSFDHPTDVVLPGAKFGRNKVTGLIRQVISRESLINPGLGPYSVLLNNTGVVLKRRDPSVVYWSWESKSSLKLIPILKSILALDPRTKGLVPLYVDNDEEEYYMYTSPDESSSSFVSLDISGQIKVNIWSQANQTWQAIYAQPADPCTPSAT